MNEPDYSALIPAGMVVHERGSVVFANEAFCAMLGRPRDEIVGHRLEDFLESDEARRVTERYERRARGEPVPREYEVSIVRGTDGARRVVEITVKLEGDRGVVLVRDVTEVVARRSRRLALAHLGASLHAHRSEDDVMRALRTGCSALGLFSAWLVAADEGRWRVVRAGLDGSDVALERALGRPLEGLVGDDIPWLRRASIEGECYADDAVAEVVRFVGRGALPVIRELAVARGMTRGVAIRVDDDGATALVVLCGDWLREDDLVLAPVLRSQLAAALDNARHISDAWRRVRDLEAVNALTRRLLEVAPRGPDAVRACADEAALHARADEALAATIESVTRVGVENATLHAQAEARFVALRDAQARLIERERLAALGEVAAVVAHEVRNPLGVVFNSVSSLRRLVPRDGDAAALVDIVSEEAGRLNQIVGDLLDFARPIALNCRPEPLEPIVEGALAAALARTPGGEARAIRVDTALPDDLPLAFVDARLLRQALLNVMINAVEAMPHGGTLRVAARGVPEGRVEVSVRDSGSGIAPEARARLFEPFFTTRATGTGLGLAVVKRVIDAHKGEVRVDDTADEGTTFTITLPSG